MNYEVLFNISEAWQIGISVVNTDFMWWDGLKGYYGIFMKEECKKK